MPNNPLLEKALWYANELHWYVFPCREKPSDPFIEDGEEIILPAKSPYIKGGFLNASLDNNQIKKWWNKFPEAGIGISCGQSNITVIDIDIKEDKKGFDAFMRMGFADEGCFHSITPSGGMHIIYQGATESHLGRSLAVDIRGHGSYFIAPPSYVYKDGKKKSYVAVDDWIGIPREVPNNLSVKWDELRGKNKKENKQDYPMENLDVTIKKVKKALDRMNPMYADEYTTWINVGLACKRLGECGFKLWDEWSQKSSKYDPKACSYRWKRFEPHEINLGTIFHYAYEGNE